MVAQVIAGYPQNTLAVKSHKLLKLPSKGTFQCKKWPRVTGSKTRIHVMHRKKVTQVKTESVSTLHGEAILQTAS